MIMELELIYNEETQEWQQRAEPFATIEVETEEDFEFIGNAIAFYKKHIEPKTHADRIRAMSDDELAEYFGDCLCPMKINCSGPCDACIMEWLSKPAEEAKEMVENWLEFQRRIRCEEQQECDD
jgi:hypothetical protein